MQHTKPRMQRRRRRRDERNVRAGVSSPADEASIYRGEEAVTQPLKWCKLRQKIWPLRAKNEAQDLAAFKAGRKIRKSITVRSDSWRI